MVRCQHTPEGDAFVKRSAVDYVTVPGIVTEAIPKPQPIKSRNPPESPIDVAASFGLRRPSNIKSSFANSSMEKLLKRTLASTLCLYARSSMIPILEESGL